MKDKKNEALLKNPQETTPSDIDQELDLINEELIIQHLETEIDKENSTLLSIAENIICSFPSIEKLVFKFEYSHEEQRKEQVVLKYLGLILTELNNYKDSTIRDRSVDLVKKIAGKKDLDYERETSMIDLSSDNKTGKENKEKTLKTLSILNKLMWPNVAIDKEELKENLSKAPFLCKAMDETWLIENSTSQNPHVVSYIFGQNIPNYQKHLENMFFILDKYEIHIRKTKLQDSYNGEDILSEVEVISKLAPSFKITTEPKIDLLSPKNLDLEIEYNGEKALIEIATVSKRLDVELAFGAIDVPGGKIKSVLKNKFSKQLYNGTRNPEIPIIIILNLKEMYSSEKENELYGESQILLTKNDKGEIVGSSSIRKENGFYHIEGTEIVTAIIMYKSDILNGKLVGKLYQPLKDPVNKMNDSFMLRLTNSLFCDC